jgi:predicted ATPase
LFDTQWLGFIAEAHAQAGQFEDAFTALDRAAETAAATGECHYQAELYRLRGAVLAETGDTAEAASWLQQAIDTARGQQAKSLELRAVTSLARLWRDQGKRAQAHDLLAPVYDWFTEALIPRISRMPDRCSTSSDSRRAAPMGAGSSSALGDVAV